jgi:hypothetical protein
MRFPATLAWMTVTVVALGAGGTAMAQTAPAAAGPQPKGARSSLGATKTACDTGAPVDLNALANRGAAAGPHVSALDLPSSAGRPMQPDASGNNLQMIHGEATGAASTSAGTASPVVVPTESPGQGAAAVGAAAPQHAESAIRSQIGPAAKSCYENDPDPLSGRPMKLGVVIKLNPGGDVDSVRVSSDVDLSLTLTDCVRSAVRATKFAAPGGSGTTVRAAFSFTGRSDRGHPAAGADKGARASEGASVRPNR